MREREIQPILAELQALRERALAEAERRGAARDPSAANLAHTLALRAQDLSPLRERLLQLGLDPLTDLEGQALASLEAVLDAACALAGAPPIEPRAVLDRTTARALRAQRTDALLGPAPAGRAQRMLVTVSADGAERYDKVRDLLDQGMNVLRICCAEDGPEVWRGIVAHLRQAERELHVCCRVLFDLAGPVPRVGELVSKPNGRPRKIRIGRGDRLLLTREPTPGRPAQLDEDGVMLSPATVPCTLPAVLDSLKPGEPFGYDDGRARGTILERVADGVLLEFREVESNGIKIRPDRSFSFPGSRLDLPALTERDREHLALAAEMADLVGTGFVRGAEDVRTLQTELNRHRANLGLMLGVGRLQSLRNLPAILRAALEGPPTGICLDRGELGLELGSNHLARAQQEVLHLAAAAHLPVVWATPKRTDGRQPLRDTDLYLAAQAQGLMLRTTEHLVDAVRSTEALLERIARQRSTRPIRLEVDEAEG